MAAGRKAPRCLCNAVPQALKWLRSGKKWRPQPSRWTDAASDDKGWRSVVTVLACRIHHHQYATRLRDMLS